MIRGFGVDNPEYAATGGFAVSSNGKIAVLQPSYLPWLGYFDQIASVDTFVFYDDVQYTKNDWRNRNRVKSASGPVWLTVPVCGSTSLKINEVRIETGKKWQEKHRKTLAQLYSKATFFDEVSAMLEPLWTTRYELLVDVSVDSVTLVASYLGLKTKMLLSSSLGVQGDKNERLVAICEKLGATYYYSGAAAREYLDVELFASRGIEVAFQCYEHPVYGQLFGDFTPYLSVVDLLMNCGKDSLNILTK